MWRAIANWIQLDITSGLLKQNAFYCVKPCFSKTVGVITSLARLTWNIKISQS